MKLVRMPAEIAKERIAEMSLPALQQYLSDLRACDLSPDDGLLFASLCFAEREIVRRLSKRKYESTARLAL